MRGSRTQERQYGLWQRRENREKPGCKQGWALGAGNRHPENSPGPSGRRRASSGRRQISRWPQPLGSRHRQAGRHKHPPPCRAGGGNATSVLCTAVDRRSSVLAGSLSVFPLAPAPYSLPTANAHLLNTFLPHLNLCCALQDHLQAEWDGWDPHPATPPRAEKPGALLAQASSTVHRCLES